MGMKHTITGIIVEIGQVEKIKTFSKRTVVICDDPDAKHPNYIPFEATGEKMGLLNQFHVGANVKIGFFVNGRKWNDPKTGRDRYFPSLKLCSIYGAAVADSVPAPAEPPAESDDFGEEAVDDMPF